MSWAVTDHSCTERCLAPPLGCLYCSDLAQNLCATASSVRIDSEKNLNQKNIFYKFKNYYYELVILDLPERIWRNTKPVLKQNLRILLKIKKGDFDDKYLADAKEKQFNDLKEAKQSNSFWVTNINMYNFNKENFKKLENFHQIFNLINKKDIVNYFNKTFKENFVKGSFLPKI